MIEIIKTTTGYSIVLSQDLEDCLKKSCNAVGFTPEMTIENFLRDFMQIYLYNKNN